MNYNVDTIPIFEKQAKKLNKKHASLKNDLKVLIESLAENPNQGIDLGNGFCKIKLAIKSKNRGKSGGARVITFVKITKTTVYLASIYDKADKETISDKELLELLKQIPSS